MSCGGHVRDSVCEGENIENGLFGSTQTNPYKTRVVFKAGHGLVLLLIFAVKCFVFV